MFPSGVIATAEGLLKAAERPATLSVVVVSELGGAIPDPIIVVIFPAGSIRRIL